MASLVPLGYLFLFWTAASVFAVTDVIFDENDVDPLVAAMNKLLTAQSEVQHLSKAAARNIGVSKLSERLTAVEGEIKKLNIQQDVNSSCDAVLEKLQVQYSTIDAELKNLQTVVRSRAEQEDKQAVVQEVRGGYLKLAEEKLLGLSDFQRQIPGIVHEAYAYSEGNFGNLVDFAKVLSNITASYEVLMSLHGEMQASGHKNSSKLVVLAEAFQKEVLEQDNDPDGVKVFASAMVADLATEILIEEVISNSDQNTSKIRAIFAALNIYHPKLSDEVMQDFVDTVYETVDGEKILDYLFTQATTTQAALGMKALFWKLNDSGKLDDKFQLKLTSLLSKVQNRTDYAGLSQDQRNSVNEVIDRLPTCAKHIFFSPTVCLWNNGTKSFLEASTNHYDNARRYVVALPHEHDSLEAATPPAGAPWIVHKVNDKILFESSAYKNEYLYVAYYDPQNFPTNRYIFNWIPGGNTDRQSAFDVELEGDYCYLRSIYFNEYMTINPQLRGSAVTVSGGLPEDRTMFLWQIRDC